MVRDGEAVGGERPKILDFGIAKLGDDGADRFQTRTGAVARPRRSRSAAQ
jgi:hypothetical protein